jgi:hypothetical protein
MYARLFSLHTHQVLQLIELLRASHQTIDVLSIHMMLQWYKKKYSVIIKAEKEQLISMWVYDSSTESVFHKTSDKQEFRHSVNPCCSTINQITNTQSSFIKQDP